MPREHQVNTSPVEQGYDALLHIHLRSGKVTVLRSLQHIKHDVTTQHVIAMQNIVSWGVNDHAPRPMSLTVHVAPIPCCMVRHAQWRSATWGCGTWVYGAVRAHVVADPPLR